MTELVERPDAELIDRDSLEEDRCYQAHNLRIAGHDWRSVAQLCDYASPESAKLAVRIYLQRAAMQMSQEQREEALATAVQRYDALIKAYWPAAIAGDVVAANFVLKTAAQADRMLGLDTLHEKEGAGSSRTIIIAGNATEYSDALKQIAES